MQFHDDHLEPLAGLVLAVAPPQGAEGVDLVDEDDAGRVKPRHLEEMLHLKEVDKEVFIKHLR